MLRAAKRSAAPKSASSSIQNEQLEAEKVVSRSASSPRQKASRRATSPSCFAPTSSPACSNPNCAGPSLPYVLMGSQSFFDRKEIRDLLSYLKVIAQPADETSCCGSSIHRRAASATRRWRRSSNARSRKAVHSGRRLASVGRWRDPAKGSAAIDAFADLLQSFRRRIFAAPHQLDSHIRLLVESIRYDDEIQRQYKDPQQQLARQAIVDEFIQSMTEYLSRTAQPSLAGFLADVALDGRETETDKDEVAAENAVKLLTLHSAKGLEFPRVYLVGMEEGLLPHKRSVDATDTEIEEERRLAYVGVTRAQDHLTLTRAAARRKWGKLRPVAPLTVPVRDASRRTCGRTVSLRCRNTAALSRSANLSVVRARRFCLLVWYDCRHIRRLPSSISRMTAGFTAFRSFVDRDRPGDAFEILGFGDRRGQVLAARATGPAPSRRTAAWRRRSRGRRGRRASCRTSPCTS